MSYFVYILISKKDHKLYIGCTKDFDQRFLEHNSKKVPSTKYRAPFDVLLVETFNEKGEAFNRERFLKSLWSSRFKKKLKLEYLQSRA